MLQKSICLYKNVIAYGGAEKQLMLIANNILNSSDFKIFVLASKIDNSFLSLFDKNIEVVLIPYTSYLEQIFWLRKFLKKKKICICHAWDFRSSIIGFASTIFSDIKLIDGSIRSAYAKGMKYYNIYIFKYHLFSLLGIYIISNSFSGLKSYFLSNYKKALVIHNGVDTNKEPFFFASKNSPGFKIGMVANMRWKKDFLTFIRSGIQVLKIRNDVIFYLIGDGDDIEKYKKYLSNYEKKESFIFTGHCNNPVSYIEQMDICVLANCQSGEGLSNSIMEYMACGKPVIATELGGNNELVLDGVTGYLVDEYDFKLISHKILHLLSCDKKRIEMGNYGREIINRKFSVKTMINKYFALYNKLANS